MTNTGQHRRKHIYPATLALACAGCYFCADYVLNAYTFGVGWTIFWPLNGITIGILISKRRQDWPLLLLGIALGTGLAELFDNNSPVSEVWQRLFSLIEVVLSAIVLPRFVTLEQWLRTPRLFARFVAAVALGPAISGIMAAIYFHLSQQQPYMVAFNDWATSDAIGIAVMLPLTLSIRSPEMAGLFVGRSLPRTLGTLALASFVIAELFSNHRFPLLWMLYPALLLVDSTLSFAGTAIALAILCLISVYATSHGRGPFGVWPSDSPLSREQALQFFLGFQVVALFPASLLFRERKRIAAELSASNEQLQELASIDGLTEIPNRRSLDQRFDTEWKRAVRTQNSLALLMVDIDNFKQFNDLYGHQSGDECLKLVAEELSTSIRRPQDFVARYGGEEFAVLLPHTDLDGALLVAEILRKAVQSLEIPHSGSQVGAVTVSIGCSAYEPVMGEFRQQLLEAADAALYHAKKSGRNRVESKQCISALNVVEPGFRI